MSSIDNSPFIEPFIQFDSAYDFYVVSIIKRTKDGHAKTGIIDEHYVYCLTDLFSYVFKNKKLCDDNNYRIYINPNRRRMDKMGIRCIKQISDYVISQQYNSIPNTFYKVVGNCNDEPLKKWIVDIDTTDKNVHSEVFDFILRKHSQHTDAKHPYKIYCTLQTPDGFHIVTNPFDLNNFKKVFLYKGSSYVDKITIHKNSPTLIYSPDVKMTSQEWFNKLFKGKNFKILDPDGWDRSNYEYSFHEERIDKGEFMGRVFMSTCEGSIV